MDNNPDVLGQDLEVQVAPEPTNEPAPLVYDPEAKFVTRHPFTGELTERDAYSVSRAFTNVESLAETRDLLQSRIIRVEALLKETLAEVSDSEWIDFIKEIAEALNISLTRTVSVTATVEHTFEVEVKLGEDDPTEYDFTFSVTSYDWDIECERESVSDFEVDEA
jgi:hypothetical protein